MPQYLGKQSVMDEALGEYRDLGFSIKEPDAHTIEVYFKDKRIAVYFQMKVTIETLRAGCKNYVDNTMREI